MNHNSKRVLIFCPKFFGYENRVANAFRSNGYDVDLYNERPSDGFIAKVAIRKNWRFYKPVIKKYLNQVIEQNKDKKYDYIIVFRGETIGERELLQLKTAFPNAKTIFYLWDSVENTIESKKKINIYDKVFTFDPNDAEKYNLVFLSLPYGEEYTSEVPTSETEYDLAFIGTAHSIRPRIVKELKKQCEEMNLKMFIFFYSPHILVYLFNKLFNKDYKYISLKEINFKSLTTAEVCDIYNKATCILDISHPNQNGTTTRPVEMLAMKKKIITTNTNVKDFDYFDQNDFLIIDKQNPKLDKSFFESEYVPVKKDILYKYSPENFVKTILEE